MSSLGKTANQALQDLDTLVAANTADIATLEDALAALSGQNYLYHSLTHDLWQAGATWNDIADDSYVADVWNVLHSGNAPDVSGQAGGASDPFTRYFRCTFDTNSSQAGVVQFLEAKDAKALRGQTVSISADLWGTNISTLRMAVVEWASTADSLTSDIVGTWGAGNPTLAANWSYIGTPGAISINSTRTRYSVDGLVIGSSVNNIGVFIWTDAAEDSGDLFNVANVKLEVSPVATGFVARAFDEEFSLCQRFLTRISQDGGAFTRYAFGRAQSTTEATLVIFLPKTLRTAPTYSVSAVSDFKTANLGTAVSTLILNTGTTNAQSLAISVASGLTVGEIVELYSDVSTAFMQFDARL